MKNRLLVALLLVALSLIGAAGVAGANAGPPRMQGDKNGLMLPGSTGQVHVLRERLRFDVTDDLNQATVTAQYQMENRGAAVKEFPVVFVWQARGQKAAAVSWNGRRLEARAPDLSGLSAAQRDEMARAWTAMETAVDPVTGAEYEGKFDEFGNSLVGYLTFVLDLEAGATGTLEVQYQHAAAFDKNRHAHPTYIYQYLLLPARSWASFGPLEIAVKAPGPDAAFFASNLPLKWEGGEYRATFPGLPEQNLAFSFTSRAGIIGSMTSTGPYFTASLVLILVGAVLAGLGLGRLCGLIRSRAWALVAGIGSGLVLGGLADIALAFIVPSFFPALSDSGYSLAFFALGAVLLAAPTTTVLAAVGAGRWNRRRYGAAL